MSEEKRRSGAKSPTGHVPRVDPVTGKVSDPPQPPNLPEFPDSDGTTGFMPVIRMEPVDSSKEADDSANDSQSDQASSKRPK
ncbi:MAG: hypothetical protein KJ065_20950 [Anaerolineae bacterium]|nr:hypothetical protein [Anaerolineae bacterium]